MKRLSKQQRISSYADAYVSDYGFEQRMVESRQRVLLDLLARASPRCVLEVGCGAQLLFPVALAAGIDVRRWVIVEPAPAFADAAEAAAAATSACDVRIVRGFVEDCSAEVAAACVEPPAVVLVPVLLHEIADPVGLLRVLHGLIASDGILHASVPNALSLHRRLARAMGLIAHEKVPSERNLRLMQPHLFDLADLAAILAAAGFSVRDSGGYLLKPFTHAQMESIAALVTPEVLDGLWQLGRELPELASEIFVDASPSP
jgi:SAM-dependent methyltransferase